MRTGWQSRIDMDRRTQHRQSLRTLMPQAAAPDQRTFHREYRSRATFIHRAGRPA